MSRRNARRFSPRSSAGVLKPVGPPVTVVSPSTVAANSPALVTITGVGFTVSTVIRVESQVLTPTFVNSTTLTIDLTGHLSPVTQPTVVQAQNPGTRFGLSQPLNVTGAPIITSAAPAAGKAAGGTVATVTGMQFVAGCTCTLGVVTFVSSTTLTVTTGAHAAGAFSFTVTNPDTQVSGSSSYTYLAPPVFSSIAPTHGPATLAGNAVTITATGLNAAAVESATIGGAAITGITKTATTISGGAPTGTVGAQDVVITVDGLTSTGTAAYTYDAAPTISNATPITGASTGGTTVTITGTGFVNGCAATLGGVSQAVAFVSSVSLTFPSATHSGTSAALTIVVTNPDAQTATRAAAFSYAAPASISASPNNGLIGGGTSVTVSGTGVGASPAVTFGGVTATSIVRVSESSITCNTPAHATGQVDVVVTNTDAVSGTGTNAFQYFATPVVTTSAPEVGFAAGGQAITITGVNFTGATAVAVGGASATSVVAASDTSITCVTPSGTAGLANIVVTGPGGAGTGTSIYGYYPDGAHTWYRGDMGVTSSGGRVSAWADQTGNGHTALNNTGLNQPFTSPATYNGRDAIHSDGTNRYLASASFAALAQPSTIFVVGRTFDQTIVSFFFDGSPSNRHVMYFPASGQVSVFAGTSLSGTSSVIQALTVAECTFNGGSSEYRQNGTVLVSGNAGAGTVDTWQLFTAYSGGLPLNGDICEFLVYNSNLSAPNRVAIRAIMKQFWGTP